MHPDQLSLSVATVRVLIADQFPVWSELPVVQVSSEGTVNALFRLGDRFVARFPLRPRDVDVIRQELQSEAAAAGELFGRTPFATPEPLGLGEPGAGFPLPWSVQTWIPGSTATVVDPGTSFGFADDLASFIRAVRAIDTRGRTFDGSGRGGHLPAADAWMEECFEHSTALFDVARLRQLWAGLRALPRMSPDVMAHGDLIPGNVLVGNGRLAGVLDVGGFGPADPALDLVGGWHLLEAGPRQALREQLGSDDLEWERGKAWAFEQALGAAWYYVGSNEHMSRMGRRTIARILADEAPGTSTIESG
jgi:aminoglycoside phosphotransferase (APT) family kinase protein